MSWFFKVARGWAPYSKEQSERLEVGFQAFQSGSTEHVMLDAWRIDLEKMRLECNAANAESCIQYCTFGVSLVVNLGLYRNSLVACVAGSAPSVQL